MSGTGSTPAPVPVQAPRKWSDRISPSSSPAVWSHAPTLAQVAGEQYLGRIVVEIFDNGGNVAFMGAEMTLVSRAIATLQQGGSLPRETPTWPAEPIMGRASTNQPYLGRIVIEMWQGTTKVGGSSGIATSDGLMQRAVQALQSFAVR